MREMQILNLFIGVAHAQATSSFNLDSFNFLNPIVPGANPLTTVNLLIGNIFGIILTGAAITAFIYLLLAGFKYITSGGDTAKAEEGRKGIVNSLVGVIIILLSYVILRFVGTSLLGGVSTTNTSTKTPTTQTGSGGTTSSTPAQQQAAQQQAIQAAAAAAQIAAGVVPGGFGGILYQAVGNVIKGVLGGTTAMAAASPTAADCANQSPNVGRDTSNNCVDLNGNIVKDSSGNPIPWDKTGNTFVTVASPSDCSVKDLLVEDDGNGYCLDVATGEYVRDPVTNDSISYGSVINSGTYGSPNCDIGYIVDSSGACIFDPSLGNDPTVGAPTGLDGSYI